MPAVASFTINLTRFLAPDGGELGPLPAVARDPAALVPLYRAMARTRAFDARAVALQRAGELGTYASSLGQEAAVVGLAAAMRADDVLVPSFREHGAQLWRGVTLVELFALWGGDERGNDFAGPREDFPVSIPVASHTQHAAGVALALKLKGGGRAAVSVSGDGSTSKGDFAEALNVAALWALPVVYVVINNQWAISVPRTRQTAAETLAQKAIAAGMPGEQVDGNDAIAVRHVVGEALARARAGGGPTLVEALSYRLADHTTADDASRYRDPALVSAAWAEDPIARLRAWLAAKGVWRKDDETALFAALHDEIDAAVDAYRAMAPQPPEAMFDHLYATLPDAYAGQRQEAIDRAAQSRPDNG